MKDGFRPSKPSTTGEPKRSEAEPGGFVSATEIRNAWQEWLRKLDVEVWPRTGRVPSREEVIELFESLQFRLLTRATSNYEKFAKKPLQSKPAPAPDDPGASAAYQARQQKLTRFHNT